MTHASIGFMVLLVAGMMNASFTLPMKYTRGWAWENTWFAWTICALVVLPLLITASTVPSLATVYSSASIGVVERVILFGAGWGMAQVCFGLAVETIGIALTFSLVLGTSAAVGALVPLVRLHPERLRTTAGHGVLLGVAFVIAGVAACAIAGRMRDRAEHGREGVKKTSTWGIVLALLCGFGASFINLGLAFGSPLAERARDFGAGTLGAPNAVWLPLMLAGAIPNLLYCGWLLMRKRTASGFARQGGRNWALAVIMSVLWLGSTLLYGVAATTLGSLGPILGWPIFMSLIVMMASLLGMKTGEWKHAGRGPVLVQWGGVALLVVAVFILATANRHMS